MTFTKSNTKNELLEEIERLLGEVNRLESENKTLQDNLTQLGNDLNEAYKANKECAEENLRLNGQLENCKPSLKNGDNKLQGITFSDGMWCIDGCKYQTIEEAITYKERLNNG